MMYTSLEKSLLTNCTLCPRECGVNRLEGEMGYCNSDAGFSIASICNHKGEEPVISGTKGICNVFFAHCNLQCIYCQNHEISDNRKPTTSLSQTLDDVVEKICATLDQSENIVGFVSPTHYIPQMIAIIRGLHDKDRFPVVVYNSNGYDSVPALKMLEGLIDVYLPDFKYMDVVLAHHYSDAKDYPMFALAAIKEMFRQKGSGLRLDDNGLAESGMIIRHLVLPGAVENSNEVLKVVAEEISEKCHVSLMAQYYPIGLLTKHSVLNRTITMEEYLQIENYFYTIGLFRGWLQDLHSQSIYRPDFSYEYPFDNENA